MTTYKKIAAVTTTIRILKYLADQREPIAGKQIAEALGIPYPTTMCHLATLEVDNFVQKVGEHFEVGQGAALIWSRRRAALKSRRMQIEKNLNQLEG